MPRRRTVFDVLSVGALESTSVRAAGELDIAAALTLDRTLRDAVASARLLVLDLSRSHVHRFLWMRVIDACIRADRASCRVVVIHGSAQVRRMFALTGVRSSGPLFNSPTSSGTCGKTTRLTVSISPQRTAHAKASPLRTSPRNE